MLHLRGQRVQKDDAKAFEFFQSAFEAGHAAAEGNMVHSRLGFCLLRLC